MALLDLLLELLGLVVEAVWPDDIENVSMTCRLLQTLAIPHVQNHKNLRIQYGCLDLVVGEDVLDMSHQSPAALLCSISTDSRVAYYPTHFNIQTSHPGYFAWREGSFPDLHIGLVRRRKCSILKQHDGFRPLLQASPYLSQQEVDEWQQAILDANDGALCALLVSLLPNLQHISIIHQIGLETIYLKRMISRIINASCEPQMDVNRFKKIPTIKNSTYPHALHKLTRFTLQSPFWPNRTEKGNDANLLLHFIKLPSLRSFSGRIASESTSLAPNAARSQKSEYASHIENLELWHTLPAALQPLLSNFCSLRSFSFTAPRGHRNEGGSQFRHMLATLSQYAGHCLQELALGLEDDNAEDAGAWNEMGSLMAFEKLTVVDTDAQYLVWDEEGTSPWLSRILPPTLKTLRMGMVDEMINGLKNAVLDGIFSKGQKILRRRRHRERLYNDPSRAAYVANASNQDDDAPAQWIKRWQNLHHTAPWFELWHELWPRAEITENTPQQHVPPRNEDSPSPDGFFGLTGLQGAVFRKLLGPGEEVGVAWPDLVELKVESEDARIQDMVTKFCQAVRPDSDSVPGATKSDGQNEVSGVNRGLAT